MNFNRKEDRLSIQLISSIRDANENRRSFCIVRNISRRGVYLTAKVTFLVGQEVECIISFGEERIIFTGVVRRVQEEQIGGWGYGIEITDITEDYERVLEDFIEAGYLPGMEE